MHTVGRSPPIQPRFRNFHGNLPSNFPKDFKSLVEVGPISRKDVIRSDNLETPFDAQLTKLAAIGEEVVEQDFMGMRLQINVCFSIFDGIVLTACWLNYF